MGSTLTAFIIVMFVNVFMFLSQVAMLEINPDGTVFYSCKGSIIAQFDKNNCQEGTDRVLDDQSSTSNLPSSEGSISPTTGNVFTDTFTAIKGWITTSTGLNYFTSVLSAPYNFLKAFGLPQSFVFAVGTLWYGITLLIFVMMITGRGD